MLVQDKFREQGISVKDFGATGDGTTNDTTNVQAAFTAIRVAGGGSVYFPPGTYIIDKSIRIEKSPAGDSPSEGVDISIDERFGIRLNAVDSYQPGWRDFDMRSSRGLTITSTWKATSSTDVTLELSTETSGFHTVGQVLMVPSKVRGATSGGVCVGPSALSAAPTSTSSRHAPPSRRSSLPSRASATPRWRRCWRRPAS